MSKEFKSSKLSFTGPSPAIGNRRWIAMRRRNLPLTGDGWFVERASSGASRSSYPAGRRLVDHKPLMVAISIGHDFELRPELKRASSLPNTATQRFRHQSGGLVSTDRVEKLRLMSVRCANSYGFKPRAACPRQSPASQVCVVR